MDAFFWAALGFFVLAAVAGGVFLGLRAWRAWQAFTSFAAAAAAGAERLGAGVERLGAHTERTTAGIDELATAAARLQRGLGRARILRAAGVEVLDQLRAVRAFVPEK